MPWSNSAAQDYVLLLKNGIQNQTVMEGIWSETQEDVVQFNGEVYRDELNAAFMGRAAQGATVILQHTTDTQVTGTVGPNVAGIATDPGNTVTSPITDPYFEESDSFTHTAPHPLEITRTRFIWWSAATGTGNVVAWAWADQVISMTPVKMERF